jgi:hypothetical protein
MFLENDWAVLVIPERRKEEDEHDEEADGARRNRQPGQYRVHWA